MLAISALSKKYPKPTNAVALAATSAVYLPGDWTAGVKAGLGEYAAHSFLMPAGVLARMRLLAGGWTNPGDRFKEEASSWWGQPYKYALWNPLTTYQSLLDKAGIDAPFAWDDSLAAGNQAAIVNALELAKEDLDNIVRAGRSKCPPYIIPTGVGVMPMPNPVCPPDKVEDVAKIPVEVIQRASEIPWWFWLVLVAAVAASKKDKR